MIDVDAFIQRAEDLYSQWKIIILSGKIKSMKNDVIKLNFPASWLSDFVIKMYLNFINQHKSMRQTEIDCLLKLHKGQNTSYLKPTKARNASKSI